MHDTIKYPAVLVRKAVLTALVGIGCFLVGGIGFIVSHDRTLLALSAAVFVFSVYRAGRIALLVLNGKYDMVEGFCVGIAAKPFGKLRKINIMDAEGKESSIMLGKQTHLRIGGLYRFYFQKDATLCSGNQYLDSSLSSGSFLGYEMIGMFEEKE